MKRVAYFHKHYFFCIITEEFCDHGTSIVYWEAVQYILMSTALRDYFGKWLRPIKILDYNKDIAKLRLAFDGPFWSSK